MKEQDLHITLIQTDLHWENPTANLAMLEEKIATIAYPTDVIILPEMFTSGFSNNIAVFSETINQTTHRWMRQMAAQTQAVVTGSVAIKTGEKVANRLLWVQPDGQTFYYDKRHLFRIGLENDSFVAGNQQVVFSWKGWNICPIICYDLRFPVWIRNASLRYDLLINVASWPAARKFVWQTLLPARAIENLAFVAGVNRIGTDGNDTAHEGLSAVYDFKGQLLTQPTEKEEIIQILLSKNALLDFRAKFPAYLDADNFTLNL